MLKLGAQVCKKTLCNFIKSPVVDKVKKENLILINAQLVRKTSFFAKQSKEDLWKGTLSVSNAGKKKGRGRGKSLLQKKSMKVGGTSKEGEIRVSWPGFNTHVLKYNKTDEIKLLPKVEKTKDLKPEVRKRRSRRIHPLLRGWTGKTVEGRKLGPPEPFESLIVAVGNGDGLLGVAQVEKFDGKTAISVAQKRASKKLISIDLIEKHTVNHSFCSEFGKTKVIVSKMPKGYGLRCHRALREICKLVGIENLHAKIEGSCNVINAIKAFIVGLLRQKTYQEIADEKKLHLVEFKEESHNYPLVLASPKECLPLSVARKNPVIFDEYIMGNRLVYKRDRRIPFFEKLPSWQKYLLKTLYCRNHSEVKIDLLVKYGAYSSYLTSIYPECIRHVPKKVEKTTEEEL